MPGILRFVSMPFLIFEKGVSTKTVPGILRFVSILFLIFEKRNKQKTAPGILRFVGMLFFDIWKRNEQKSCASYFEISKYAFQCDYFLIWMGVIGIFGVCKYPLLIFNIKGFIEMFKIVCMLF